MATASSDPIGDDSEVVPPLDPYQACAKRNMKNAKETTEVYLAKRGATELSDNFKHFENLEVVWFNDNRLSRLENLTTNFRIREVFVQDNRLVSLAGISSFKFLRVLLASNNQLRNLEKQLDLLERFNFLKKLDLFGNPCAEEPDYRLRLIYQCPQVEILDKKIVRDPERLKADEVVPNLDKASAPKPEPSRKKRDKLSVVERDCFNAARTIKHERQRMEDEALGLGQTFAKTMNDEHYRLGMLNDERTRFREMRTNPREMWKVGTEFRGKPTMNLTMSKQAHGPSHPSNYEMLEMRLQIQRALKKVVAEGSDATEVTRDDIVRLAEVLATDGIEEVGRVLGDGAVFRDAGSSQTARVSATVPESSTAPTQEEMENLFADPEARVPVGEGTFIRCSCGEVYDHKKRDLRECGKCGKKRSLVIDWLLNKPWPHVSDDVLEDRMRKMQDDQKWSHLGRNYEALQALVTDARKVIPAGVSKDELATRRGRTGSAAHVSARSIGNPEELTLHEALALPVRYEGIKSSKEEVRLHASTQESGTMRKHRSDVFKQTFLMAQRGAVADGQIAPSLAPKLGHHRKQNCLDRVAMTIKVSHGSASTSLGG